MAEYLFAGGKSQGDPSTEGTVVLGFSSDV
jgi:hypothetical protein